MKGEFRGYARTGFFLSAIGAILIVLLLIAFPDHMKESEKHLFEIAFNSLLVHGFTIALLALSHRKFNEKRLVYSMWMFIIGILLFSSALSVVAALPIFGLEEDIDYFNVIYPIGGIILMAAWVMLAFNGFTTTGESESNSKTKHKHKHRHTSHKSMAELARSERESVSSDDENQ